MKFPTQWASKKKDPIEHQDPRGHCVADGSVVRRGSGIGNEHYHWTNLLGMSPTI